MARKRSSRRPVKKTTKRKTTAKRKSPARKKPARKKPRKALVTRSQAKKVQVAGAYAGDPPAGYLAGGTIPPPAP
jgi:hypothetical protein